MANVLALVALAVIGVMSTVAPAVGASIRNAYFTNGETVPGQLYRTEGELPGATKVFRKETDKNARLFVIFGDLDAHKVTGTLKAADGRVVSRLNRQWPSYTGSVNVRWRLFNHAFGLQRLAPGEYQLELVVDDTAHGTYGFTLQ